MNRIDVIRRLFAAGICMWMSPALADCATVGRQAKEGDSRLSAAMDEYSRTAAKIRKISDQREKFAQGSAAVAMLLDAFNLQIASLEKGKSEGCFGAKSAEWDAILSALKSKRAEFERERDTIANAAGQPATRGDWKAHLTPAIEAFTACLVLKKRSYLAPGQSRPSPADFALIIQGSCNTQEAQIETEQDKISGWTAEDRQNIKASLTSVRARVIADYTEAAHK